MNYGALILAGGKSSRMKTSKAELRLNGVRFLDKLVYELSSYNELLVSVDDAQLHPEIEYPMVSDTIADCGPMGGLYSALKACTSDALIVVPCDVPLFSKALTERFCAYMEMEIEADAVIAATKDGREHPLCGVYKKSCLDILEQCLKKQDYRMRDALTKLCVKVCQVGEDSWRLKNINTPEEFQEMSYYSSGFVHADIKKQQMHSCLAISGWKNAGKTTLIEKLIPLLTQSGLKVATVKHDGHIFEPDVPGTDSFRFFKAGADVSMIYDKSKYSLTRRVGITYEDVPDLVPDVDIILLEGFKWTNYSKIEVVRKENGKMPLSYLKGRIAYVSDLELPTELPVFNPNDIKEIAMFIIEAYKDGRLKERWNDE